MKQKFFRGQRVKLADDFGSCMSHFGGKGGEAIIEHSYSDNYGGENYDDFCLLILSGKEDDIYPYSSAWYHTHQMVLMSDDRVRGEKALQLYNEFESDERTDRMRQKTYIRKKGELLNKIWKVLGVKKCTSS